MNTLMNETPQKHELGFLIGMLAIFMGIVALYFGVFYLTTSNSENSRNAERLEAQV